VARFPQLRYVRNWISIGGALVTTISAVLFLVIFGLEIFGFHTNPYIGIVVFLILPGFFVGGLLVIPVGMWNERRRQRSGRAPSKPKWPSLDLNDPTTRRVTFVVLVMTFVNVVIVSLAAYRGVEYMDSVGFCGQVCHQVMQPEFTAYQDGPHARVACVQCHIGPGAPWFVRSKLSGVRQVFAVLANTYSRPIPSPVQNLRPARDTCEQCHWPAMFHGDKVIVEREYADDKANTETDTTLQLHVGGGGELDVMGVGIHWHVAAANTIEYVATDEKRQVIPWVRLTVAGAPPVVFRSDGLSGNDPPPGELRTMDCVDCHNRPTHPFAASAERAVDAAIADGRIASSLPYVRREAVRLLKVAYPTREDALQAIATELPAFYQGADGGAPVDEATVAQAVRVVQDLYGRNVFPVMDITWGTYTNNIGHTDSPGCFRCHDDSHNAGDGRVIKQDCETCHSFQ
jgi:hypothetical protein